MIKEVISLFTGGGVVTKVEQPPEQQSQASPVYASTSASRAVDVKPLSPAPAGYKHYINRYQVGTDGDREQVRRTAQALNNIGWSPQILFNCLEIRGDTKDQSGSNTPLGLPSGIQEELREHANGFIYVRQIRGDEVVENTVDFTSSSGLSVAQVNMQQANPSGQTRYLINAVEYPHPARLSSREEGNTDSLSDRIHQFINSPQEPEQSGRNRPFRNLTDEIENFVTNKKPVS